MKRKCLLPVSSECVEAKFIKCIANGVRVYYIKESHSSIDVTFFDVREKVEYTKLFENVRHTLLSKGV